MTFDNSLPHALPWNYPWLKDEIERRDEYIAQLEAELAHQRPQNHDSGAIEGESVKVPAEDESGAHSEPDSREKLEADIDGIISDALRNLRTAIYQCVEQGMDVLSFSDGEFIDFEHEEFVGEYVGRAMEVLDRQDAITRAEVFEEGEYDCMTCGAKRELQERVDSLTAELACKPKQAVDKQADCGTEEGCASQVPQSDSRERLEADLKTCLYEFGGYCFNSREGHTDNVDTFFDDFVFLLDRQESITERYWMQINGANASANIVLNKRIKELEHQRTVMAKKLMQAERDRDRYRAALGKAIDCADEIRRLA